MTGTFKVDTGKLVSTANTLDSTGNQIKNITNQMTSLVNELSGAVWTSDAATAYKKKFGELQDDINKMVRMVSEHVTDLNEMAKEYERAEEANVNLANALAGDVIV
jgi:WXG100 family type VII secretion target